MFFQTEKWNIVNAIAGTVSALAAAVTVIVAAWTLRRAAEDKARDDEAKKPEFEMYGQVSAVEDKDRHRLYVSFQNRGVNPAKDIVAKLSLIGPTWQKNEVYKFETDIVGLVQPISSFGFDEEFRLTNEGSPHAFYVKISYVDARTNKHYVQEIYKEWIGLQALVDAGFRDIGTKEVDVIQRSGLVPP
ncbi:MAG TPA: hypothetical protein VF435_01165 [Pyrinomonadaceae bacterium]